MNKKNLLITCCIFLIAASPLFAQKTFVPDDNFEQALIDLRYDTVLDDSVLTANISSVTYLNVTNKNISDLTGIEGFVALEELYCFANQISEIKTSALTNLKILNCQNNQITDLDLSSNTLLVNLNARNNQLTGLNLRNGNNHNMDIEVRYNPDLLCIQVDDPVASYDFSEWYKNTYTAYTEDCSTYVPEMTYVPDDNFEQALIDLKLDSGELNDSVPTIAINNIKYLNVSVKNIYDLTGIEDCVALEELYCHTNQISEINLSALTNLKILKCQNNPISDLDISSNTLLINLNASNNNLTGLDLRNGNNSNMDIDVRYNPDLLCIQVDDPIASYEYTNWYKNAYTAYTEDCSNYIIEMTYVPDDNFEQILINQGLDFGPLNDSVPTIAVKTITILNIDNKSISDLTGIEDFENIKTLSCNFNNIEFLDLSKNIELLELNCYHNKLTSLNLQNNINLTKLHCQNNPLVLINLDNNINLQHLDCNYCQLTNINIQNNNKLESFSAGKNPPLCIMVNDIEIAKNNSNWHIDPWANYSLDCSGHNVEKIYLPDDNFENALISMGYDYGIANDSVYKAIISSIKNLQIYNQGIKSLQGIENFSALESLNINNNDITELVIDSLFNLKELSLLNNNVSNLNIFLNTKLAELNCSGNQLSTINLQSCADLQALDCIGNNLQNLDLSNNLKLIDLRCHDNNLKDLNLSVNTFLKNISCGYNQISSLDLSHQDSLEYLSCNNNNLTGLNLSENMHLKSINCSYNQLASLDIGKNINLTYLNCENNNLTSLNLQNGNNEIIRAVNAINNPNLLCIQVDNPILSENNSKWKKDEQASYSVDCNPSVAGIPAEEYNSLVDLYQSTVGHFWTNNTNWLDTTTCKVNDWFGITVENGHVTKIELPANNLQEEIFNSRLYLPELEILDISNNLLVAANFYSLDSLSKLKILKIENNNFLFKHIEPVFYLPKYEQLAAGFTYSPQAKIDIPENVEITLNQNYSLSVSENYISPNDQFLWFKDGMELEGENNSTIEFLQVTKADSGSYQLQITNPGVPGLTLYSYYKSLYVNSPWVAGAGVPISEYNALVDFYNSMNGKNWTRNDNWLDTINQSVNDWYGVWVENGHVIRIGFNNINVKGEIPASIINLSGLKELSFNKCEIKNKISDGLIQIPTLTNVFIRECKLTDSFNDIISNSPESLQILNLELNNVSGTIPDEIGNKNFKQIWITGNNISGQIPSSIGNLTQLFVFYAANNNLTGKIPAEFGNITGIQTVILSNNKIEGPLPTSLQNLVNLEDFVLDNNLIGTQSFDSISSYTKKAVANAERQIPDELSNLIALNQLKIENNNLMFNDVESIFSWQNFNEIKDFTYYPQDSVGTSSVIHKTENENVTLSIDNYYPGPSDQYQWYKNGVKIPGAKSAQLNLNNLQPEDSGRYYCKITNPVASDLTLFSRINSLAVEPAPASAGIPVAEYMALAELYHSTQGPNWKVNTNWLDTINCSVKDWANVQVVGGHVTNLYLDSNNVVGVLPDELVNLNYLQGLYLFGNGITGEIPQNIANLTNLLTLSLSHNNLTGEIPESIFQLQKLEHLHLNHNNLDGMIHPEIKNLENLRSLFLDNNNLNGTIPPEIGNLTKLRHLNLSHNALTGVIPAETGNLTELRSLILSNNFLEGPVPAELNNLTKAYRIDINNNLIGNNNSVEKSAFIKSGIEDNNRQIPDELAGLMQMDTLYLGGNKLQFNDIEAIFSWENFSEFEDFIYAPQDSVGWAKTLEGETGHEITIELDNYFPGPSDQYQWYKNGEILAGANSQSHFIENLAEADSGKYVCKITNPVAIDLELYSREIKLTVTKSTGITNAAQNSVSVYPNPAAGRLFLDIKNHQANLEIYNVTGRLVQTLPEVSNGWINVNNLKEGIYLFKFNLKGEMPVIKKVIIRN